MENVNVTIRMDRDLKKEAEDLFDQLGMSLTTAVNIFVRQAVRTQSIPFQVNAMTVGVDPRAVGIATSIMDEYSADFAKLAE